MKECKSEITTYDRKREDYWDLAEERAKLRRPKLKGKE